MKRNIINTLWGVLLGSMLLFAGCNEPEEVITPDFPEKISATVAAGEQFNFTITPNMQWTLKISTEATTHFAFIKGASELYTLHGTAGEHQITVAVSDSEEFDTVRVCEIEMTMGEESHIVAVLTRGGKERELKLYAAEFDTEEEYFVEEDSQWVYSTTEADNIEWVWCNEQWMQRLLVDANFRWTMGANTPAWLNTNNTNGKVGQTELFFRVNRERLPLEDTECSIDFCDSVDRNGDGNISDDEVVVVRSYKTQMEGCKNICEVSLAGELVFNAEGEYEQSASSSYSELANGRIYSPRGAELFAVVASEAGGYTTEGSEWILLTIDDFPSGAGEEGVWERLLQLDVEVNSENSARTGYLVALPKPVAEAGNANWEEYIICTITQQGVQSADTDEAIVAYDEDLMIAYASKLEKIKEGEWPWNGAWASIPYAYKLTYRDNSSGSEVIFNKPFSRYIIYGYNGLSSDKYDIESCWVTLEESQLTDMDGNTVENAYRFRSRLGTEEGEFENTMPGTNGDNRAVFVFYDAQNNPYALLYFVLDPDFSPYSGSMGDVTFVDPEAAYNNGASLSLLSKGDDYFSLEDDYMGTLQYLLTLTSKSQSIDLVVPNHSYSWSYKGWITTESSGTSANIAIYTPSLPAADSESEDIIGENTYKGLVSFYPNMSTTTPTLQLHIIYKAE